MKVTVLTIFQIIFCKRLLLVFFSFFSFFFLAVYSFSFSSPLAELNGLRFVLLGHFLGTYSVKGAVGTGSCKRGVGDRLQSQIWRRECYSGHAGRTSVTA